jgi:hypothetical protein
MGGGQLLAYLRSTLSNVLRILDCVRVDAVSPQAAVEEAFIGNCSDTHNRE